jgi:hypothetical protein
MMGTRIGIQGTKSRTSPSYASAAGSRGARSVGSHAPYWLWTAITLGWFLLISGFFEGQLGTPGLVQVFRLRAFLAEKQGKVQQLETELAAIEAAIQRIDQSPVVLEREIRRTLGYVAPEDLIFDFTASESASNPASGRGSSFQRRD